MSYLNTRTPPGDDVTQRSDLKPAFSEDLLERVLQWGNLQTAWKRVRANKGAAGIDGMTIDEFPAWARSGHWKRIVAELETGRYRPSPVRRVEIDKPDGGTRQLGIPTVVDRVIQQAIAQVLTPIFDPGFSNNSFGFRPGRNGQHWHGTLTKARKMNHTDSTRNSTADTRYRHRGFFVPAQNVRSIYGRVERRNTRPLCGNRPGASVDALVETRLPITTWQLKLTANQQEANHG